MATFVPFNRDQSFLLPPDSKEWLPEDDLAHFIVPAVERVPLDAFRVKAVASGKARYHPRLMLGLLVYTVEPAFGIIKSAMGFVRFRLRGIHNVATDWALIALAYNCRRVHRPGLA